MRIPLTLGCSLVLAIGLCAQDSRKARTTGKDIVDVAVGAGQFGTLIKAVQAAGLVDALRGEGPLTVFAPTDAAFAKLPEGTVASLLKPENKDRLVAILTYHVVSGNLPASKVVKAKAVTTLNGAKAPIEVSDAGVKVAGASVVKTDIMADNGVIHVIDSVMLPPTGEPNIVEVATKAGQFNTLLTAVRAAGLADALCGDGPFTVLAPTDAAFAKLGTDTITGLLRPENKAKLQQILKLHVIPAKVTARDAVIAGKARTLQGGEVKVSIVNGRLTIDGASVLASDVMASNGVIHAIDTVLLPR